MLKDICHLITTFESGGAENQLLILSRHQVSRGWNVKILYLKGEGNLTHLAQNLGIEVDNTLANKNILLQLFSLHKFVKLNQKMIFHVHLPRAELLFFIASIGESIRSFTSRHNTEPFFPFVTTRFSSLISRLVTKRNEGVIAISNSVRKFVLERNELHPSTPLQVIHYGYDDSLSPTRIPKEYRNPNSLHFVYVGRIVEQKNVALLIDVFKTFALSHPNVYLHIFGDGPLKRKLQEVSASRNQEISWHGKISSVPLRLAAMDALVLPSKYEGFGLVLLEAMQVGIPVIASDTPAISEVMGNQYPGLFVNENESSFLELMNSFAAQPQFRKQLQEYGQERLKLYSPFLMVDAIEELYFHSKKEVR